MFKKIFVEEAVQDHPRTLRLLSQFKKKPILIRKVEDIFGRVNKRHTEKDYNLFLFIGRKEGDLVKKAPPAYGFKKNERHFYFIHAYNCIYNCRYCYLQGYFSSPDLVVFVNHEEIIDEMGNILSQYPRERIWFHAGEFSDSLAFPFHAQEWSLYWNFFRHNLNALLELRTKSNQIRYLDELEPLPNVIISFSLNPPAIVRKYENKTPSTEKRLQAMRSLAFRGYKLGIHLDPVIYNPNFELQYGTLINEISQLPLKNISYISLGTMRFNRNFFKKNPQHQNLIGEEMITGFDNKTRYLRPLRLKMAAFIKSRLMDGGYPEKNIYYCMEEEPV